MIQNPYKDSWEGQIECSYSTEPDKNHKIAQGYKNTSTTEKWLKENDKNHTTPRPSKEYVAKPKPNNVFLPNAPCKRCGEVMPPREREKCSF